MPVKIFELKYLYISVQNNIIRNIFKLIELVLSLQSSLEIVLRVLY